ncbi:hypothetical protein KP509_35G040200 [Ceratopteris richardii]|uniref:Uncharacterized protein n=1 Tax=Ceratopteris richardii TaxID=49495 RepID=A0A8T2QFF6_CERRI|nr:hypothetical protein KP509_35G040200 [Ceratopteris richardii]
MIFLWMDYERVFQHDSSHKINENQMLYNRCSEYLAVIHSISLSTIYISPNLFCKNLLQSRVEGSKIIYVFYPRVLKLILKCGSVLSIRVYAPGVICVHDLTSLLSKSNIFMMVHSIEI